MLDPLTSLGLASNVIQLIDFGVRLTREVKGCVDSASASLPSNAGLQDLLQEYRRLTPDPKLAKCESGTLSGDEQATVESSKLLRDEIDALASDLEKLEVEPSPKRIKRAARATLRATQTVLKKSELEDRRRRLAELTNVLSARMLQSLIDRADNAFVALSSSLRRAQINSARDVIEDRERIQQLITEAEKREFSDRRTAIIDSLRYDQMENRFRIIPEHHCATYGWCFDAHASPFPGWLKQNNGIFWIRGLAGAGKSTLMKFLTHDNRTKSHLREWSGDHTLVTAHHYFHYAGTPMEKSHQGLLQSLLMQVLQADEDLVSILCKDRFEGTVADRSKHWSRKDLVQSLRNIASAEDMRFCLFVDGLDEYHPQDEHDKLISELKSLAQIPNIKLCVSSRPWDEFILAFGETDMQLRLEDLTWDDIVSYTQDNLHNASVEYCKYVDDFSASDIESLALKVTRKAKGVFLWVYLVVSALKEHMRAANPVDKLHQCVDWFPPRLEEYFRKFIYERIPATLRQDTAQALTLARLIIQLEDKNWPINRNEIAKLRSFLPFSVLRKGMQSSTFFLQGDLQVVTLAEMRQMLKVCQKYLNACCKDLLWIPVGTDDIPKPHVFEGHRFQFLHRTVYDFLVRDDMKEILHPFVPNHFYDGAFLRDVTVACLKFDVCGRISLGFPPLESSTHFEKFSESLTPFLPELHARISATPDVAASVVHEIDRLGTRYLAKFYHPVDTEDIRAFLSTGFLQDLICCQAYSTAELWLQSTEKSLKNFSSADNQYRLLLDGREANSLLQVALGLSEKRPFSCGAVDEEFVGKLLVAGMSPNTESPNTESPNTESPNKIRSLALGSDDSIWIQYLQRWMAEVVSLSQDTVSSDIVEESSIRWNVAKLLIKHGAALKVSFWPANSIYTNVANPNGKMSVPEALRFCVPRAFRSELNTILEVNGLIISDAILRAALGLEHSGTFVPEGVDATFLAYFLSFKVDINITWEYWIASPCVEFMDKCVTGLKPAVYG